MIQVEAVAQRGGGMFETWVDVYCNDGCGIRLFIDAEERVTWAEPNEHGFEDER